MIDNLIPAKITWSFEVHSLISGFMLLMLVSNYTGKGLRGELVMREKVKQLRTLNCKDSDLTLGLKEALALVELNVTLICPTRGTRAWKDAIGCDVAAESLSRALSHWIGSPWGSLLAVLKPITELPQILQGYTMHSDSENKSYHSLWHEANMGLTASGYNTFLLYGKNNLIQHPLICLDIHFAEWLMSRKEYISHCHPTIKSTTNTLLKCTQIVLFNTYKCLHVPKTDTKPFLRTP